MYKTVGRLIAKSHGQAEIAKAFGVTLGKVNVFDAMVEAGKAKDFNDAVAQAAVKFQPKYGYKWAELAKFVAEYEAEDAKKINQ